MAASPENTVAFIGGGVANTTALETFVKEMETQKERLDLSSIHLQIYDIRMESLGGGVAYSASDPAFLFNTNGATNDFKDWLVANKEKWVSYLKQHDGGRLDSWFAENADALAADNFKDPYFPRALMGLFLQEKLFKTKEKAERLGINVEFLEGEVSELKRNPDETFHIEFQNGKARRITMEETPDGFYRFSSQEREQPSITAGNIVLGIGLPPTPAFPEAEHHPRYFSTIYETSGTPKMEQIADSILAAHESHPGRKVKIATLGAGASFLDFARYIHHTPELRDKVEIIAISPKGQPPFAYEEPPKKDKNGKDYEFPAEFLKISDATINTAEKLQDAFRKELEAVTARGSDPVEVAGAFRSVNKVINAGIEAGVMPESEAYRFYQEGRFFSTGRAYPAYILKPTRKLEEGILQQRKGSIVSVKASGAALDIQTENETIQAEIAVNFMGPTRIRESAAPLIRNIVDQKLAEINPSGRGFTIDDHREAATPGLFVTGPLTEGNVLSGATWLEKYRSSPSINSARTDGEKAGNALAERIIKNLSPTREEPSSDRGVTSAPGPERHIRDYRPHRTPGEIIQQKLRDRLPETERYL